MWSGRGVDFIEECVKVASGVGGVVRVVVVVVVECRHLKRENEP